MAVHGSVLRRARGFASLRLPLVLLLVAALTACTGAADVEADRVVDESGTSGEASDDGGEDTGAGSADLDGIEPAEPTSWTYLLYSMADNDLEEPLLQDLLESAAVGSGDDLNIVALVDRAAGEFEGAVGNLPDWEGAKVLHVMPDELVELEDLGELDTADPSELAAFIEYGITAFPADNYALTISDHGGGWTGMGPDDSSGGVMDLSEIGTALDAGLAAAGVDQLDLLGFDACLMATYEVASAMAPYASHMLASAELEPGHGWDYTVLSQIAEDPSIDAASLGTAFVDGFSAHAESFGTGADITLSLVDLSMLPALDEAMATFAGALTEQVDGLGALIGRQRAEGIDYARSPDPAQTPQLTDLGVFVSEIGVASLQVSDPADDVLRAINDAVVTQTVGPARLGSTGLSIYFPSLPELVDPSYATVAGADDWVRFLDAYHGAGQAIPVEAQPALVEAPPADEAGIAVGDALVVEVDGGVDVSIQLDPSTLDNVASASLSFGYVDPEDGAIVQLGDTEAEVLDDGTVIGFTDLTVLTMTDVDGDTIDAYLSLEFDEEAGLAYASVPLDYIDAETGEEQAVDLAIVLDGETGDVLQETYYALDAETGTYGELTADPESFIAPVVLVFGPDGSVEWTPYGDDILFADLPELQYGLELLEPGTEIYVDITVTDFGGNQVIGSATFIQE